MLPTVFFTTHGTKNYPRQIRELRNLMPAQHGARLDRLLGDTTPLMFTSVCRPLGS